MVNGELDRQVGKYWLRKAPLPLQRPHLKEYSQHCPATLLEQIPTAHLSQLAPSVQEYLVKS
jgi:hypothetical protein